ncbi:MAG: hypothetical protein CMF62_01725 [Magnetococcales bacterium]|nr:hypothetical protein [Magnetococcales bacterium]|tara:strand:+ start:72957 stop:73655 length:699 start_codon:yes stop_codon:yes gene_type:complete
MCFNIEMSTTFCIIGFLLSGFLYKNDRYSQTMIVVYYSLMELLQTISYLYKDQCNTTINLSLTWVAHILVIFQPALWSLYRYNTQRKNKEIFKFCGILSLIWAFFFTHRLFYIPTGKGILHNTLDINEVNVGENYCMLGGPKHIMWVLPYQRINGFEANYFTYLLLWFVPTLYEDNYGWLKLLYWLSQVLIVNRVCDSIHELSSIWCLASIPIVIGLFGNCLYEDYFKSKKN